MSASRIWRGSTARDACGKHQHELERALAALPEAIPLGLYPVVWHPKSLKTRSEDFGGGGDPS
jgi:hypothetical protein